jgi:hypothetical protein
MIPSTNEKDPAARRTNMICIATIFVAVCAVYAVTLSYGFLQWDDDWLVTNNRNIRGLTVENVKRMFDPTIARQGFGAEYLPVRDLSYAVDYSLWRYEAWGYHATNVLLHAICCVLVYALGRRLGFGAWGAFFAAMVFGLHPLQVESVAWVASRKGPLSLAFMLGAFLLYIDDRPASGRGSVKAVVIPFPLAVVAYDLLYKRATVRRALASWLPLFVVTAAYFFVAMDIAKSGGGGVMTGEKGMGLMDRILLMPAVFVWYVKMMVFPMASSAAYSYRDFPEAGFWVCYGVVMLTGALLAVFQNDRRGLFGLVWLAIFLLPFIHAIPLKWPVADRYAHVPLAGFAFLCVMIVGKLCGGVDAAVWTRRAMTVAGIMVVACLAVISLRDMRNWSTERRLWAHSLKQTPDSWLANYNMGNEYAKVGNLKVAAEHYNRCVKFHDYAPAWSNYANCLVELGAPEDEILRYRWHAVNTAPREPTFWRNLAEAYSRAGNESEAARCMSEAVKLESER